MEQINQHVVIKRHFYTIQHRTFYEETTANVKQKCKSVKTYLLYYEEWKKRMGSNERVQLRYSTQNPLPKELQLGKRFFRERHLTVSHDGTLLLRYLSIVFKFVTSFVYLLVTFFSLGNPRIVGLLVGEQILS